MNACTFYAHQSPLIRVIMYKILHLTLNSLCTAKSINDFIRLDRTDKHQFCETSKCWVSKFHVSRITINSLKKNCKISFCYRLMVISISMKAVTSSYCILVKILTIVRAIDVRKDCCFFTYCPCQSSFESMHKVTSKERNAYK